jgi:hypothetical protein
MPRPKLICIDITLTGAVKKADILKRIKEELDKEFETEVISQHHRVTVTCDDKSGGGGRRHKPPKKSKK